ncbi:unnamed protein product [Paramecium sonneborni]|uniref:WD40-repeat-containing domain n=1 Tax=Paramecium sonneborni TaxID=65129 RepID=A0A8S1PH57_9CILI|nr:unnamed protein product [Paramecium sonneborni]
MIKIKQTVENVKMIGKSENCQQLQKLNLIDKKILEKHTESQDRNWMIIKEAEEQILNCKLQYLKESEIRKENNIEILNHFKQNLIQMKQQMINKIDEIISFINNQLTRILNIKIERDDQYKEGSNQNLDYIEKSYIQLRQISLNFVEIETHLQQQLKTLDLQDFLKYQEKMLRSIRCENQINLKEVLPFGIDQIQKNNNWICEKHKLQLMFVDLKQISVVPNRIACAYCIPEYLVQFTNFDQFKSMWNQQISYISNFQNLQDRNVNNSIQMAHQQLIQLKDQFNCMIDESIISLRSLTLNQSKILERLLSLIKKEWYQYSKEEIIYIAEILSQQNFLKELNEQIESEQKAKIQSIQEILNELFLNLQQKFNDQKLTQCSVPIQEKNGKYLKISFKKDIPFKNLEQDENKNINVTIKPFKYELIKKNSFKDDKIYAITFNQDSSLVMTGYSFGTIKVFQFKNGYMKQTQVLQNHQGIVCCLQILKSCQQFVSGGEDQTILIWQINENKEWICLQILQRHTDYIRCIISNSNEDLIISCGDDQTIQFWNKDLQWNWQQRLLGHRNKVESISLNESNTKLVSCAYMDFTILVSEKLQYDSEWIIIQTIKVDNWGQGLCFMNDFLFSYQPSRSETLFIYELDKITNTFNKTKEVRIKSGYQSDCVFPLQFIKSNSIILNKTGCFINLISFKQNGEFVNGQSIKYQNQYIQGALTNDGQYLVTWDEGTKQVQIRIYKH